MKASAMVALKPAETIEWETPQAFFDRYNAQYRFTLDACASPTNAKCTRYFTKDDDGLAQDWGTHTVWMNPPFGRELPAWMHKAYTSSLGGATVVCLVPARVDTRWWHDYAERGAYHFPKGRLKFGGAPYNAPFPCAVVVFLPPAQTRDDTPTPIHQVPTMPARGLCVYVHPQRHDGHDSRQHSDSYGDLAALRRDEWVSDVSRLRRSGSVSRPSSKRPRVTYAPIQCRVSVMSIPKDQG